jgi:hypothetical protein
MKWGNSGRTQDSTCARIHTLTKTELERSCQQNGFKDSQTNSAVCASGQKIYRGPTKRWLETVTDHML